MIKYTVKVYCSGTKEWWLDGKRHREDGPAVEYSDGGKEWWLDGKLHREDGPAVDLTDGGKKWWLDGKRLTEEEHKRATQQTSSGKIVEIDGRQYKLVEV